VAAEPFAKLLIAGSEGTIWFIEMRAEMRRILSSFAIWALAFPAFAGEPSDVVKYFYENPDEAFNIDNPKLGASIIAVMRAHAASEEPCVDFSPVMDAQDWDEAEVKGSLKLDEKLDGDNASVAATFKLFGEDRTVDWALAKQAGGWKVTEISSKVGEWVLSKFDCK
jgi:Protein of unknown function (DUF3828)